MAFKDLKNKSFVWFKNVIKCKKLYFFKNSQNSVNLKAKNSQKNSHLLYKFTPKKLNSQKIHSLAIFKNFLNFLCYNFANFVKKPKGFGKDENGNSQE